LIASPKTLRSDPTTPVHVSFL